MATSARTPSQTPVQGKPAETRTRVCYFLHGTGVGGASLSLLYLLQQMDRQQYEPIVVCLFDSPMRERFQELGVQTIVAQGMTYFSHTTGEALSLRNPRGWLQVAMFLPSVWKTYRLVKELKPSIVHANSSTLAPQVIGAKLASAKVVWHIREHVLDGVVGLRKALLRWIARRYADALITIMEGEGQRLGVAHKTSLIYNFVDFTYFDRHLRDKAMAATPNRPKTVAMLGGVDKIKGTLELAQASLLVNEKLGNVRFVVAGYGGDGASNGAFNPRRWLSLLLGHGRYARSIRLLCKPLDPRGPELAGVVQDVPSLLAQADLVVFPSTEPHFARPLIEAGAMALPVVASDIPGPRELVVLGKTGLLVPPGDVEALAAAITTILSDDRLAKTMGEAGYEQARQLFDARANAQATFAVYEQVTHGATSSAANGGKHSEGLPSTPPRISVHPVLASLFLLWLVALFGMYVWNILQVANRWDRIQEVLGRLLS
ncbi:MAG: glycosyltransferase family 4 protein [Chloroflexi bacterium]|nr:glycosyltransferase family 4 protein [Chloroflexota bacterium]